MAILILGLVIFLGVHSTNLFAPDWRKQQVAKLGIGPWKGLYALVSLVGLVLIVWGYALARANMVWLWVPPVGLRHIAALLMLVAFVFLAAAYVPGTHIKARVGHPMLLAVKTWAVAHLLSNGTLADLVLFGGFLAWAVPLYIVLRKRDRAAVTTYPAVGATRDGMAVAIGVLLWVAFAFFLHRWLFGVAPFG